MEKLSITVTQNDLYLIEKYKILHSLKSNSQVIREALDLLKEKQLAEEYKASSSELDMSEWNSTIGDGLENESW
jgi:antitoxin ParD1/3/4